MSTASNGNDTANGTTTTLATHCPRCPPNPAGTRCLSLRGTKGVPRKGVWTSVHMRAWSCQESRATYDQTICYLRPPFHGTLSLRLFAQLRHRRCSDLLKPRAANPPSINLASMVRLSNPWVPSRLSSPAFCSGGRTGSRARTLRGALAPHPLLDFTGACHITWYHATSYYSMSGYSMRVMLCHVII